MTPYRRRRHSCAQAISWYAVACYYMCTRQYEQARRYFGKVTTMDAGFALAWIGYGHAFAAQDERDQVGAVCGGGGGGGGGEYSRGLGAVSQPGNSQSCWLE